MASQLKVAPGTVVDSFLHESYTDENGNKTLHYYREKFWQWSTNRYIKKTNATIWKEFSRWLELNMKIPARSDWATLREIMEYRLLLPEEQALPAWIGMTKPATRPQHQQARSA
jgi:hypothetical protein